MWGVRGRRGGYRQTWGVQADVGGYRQRRVYLEGREQVLAEGLAGAGDGHVRVELGQSGQRRLRPVLPHVLLPQVELGGHKEGGGGGFGVSTPPPQTPPATPGEPLWDGENPKGYLWGVFRRLWGYLRAWGGI